MEAAWSPAAVCVAAAALAGAAAAGWWALQQGRAAARPAPSGETAFDHPEGLPQSRPRPAVEPWVLVVAALAVAAIVVAPRLIGVTFLVFPFVFGRRRFGRGPGGPWRTGDHREHDDPDGAGDR